jgi:hypothetical protein
MVVIVRWQVVDVQRSLRRAAGPAFKHQPELFETRIDMGLFDCNECWLEGSQVRCPVLPLLLILLEASGKTEAPVSQIA